MRTVATLGSHCALQLLKGAKSEGFETLVISERDHAGFYKRYKFIDHHLILGRFSEVVNEANIEAIQKRDCALIPHGTLISKVGTEKVEKELKIPLFGNRYLLRWEAERELKERLMKEAGLKTPQSFSSSSDIDRLCIVKLPGAEGGRGYFLAHDSRSFKRELSKLMSSGLIRPGDEGKLYIQEYVVGVPVYLQYFYSPLNRELEFFGVDRRYETNVDGIGRLPADLQGVTDLGPTYLVVGNIPLVLRESLLDDVYKMGKRFVKASQALAPPGIIGPFCIEGVYGGGGEFVSFEFSARIVAGTNLYIEGSPYSALLYDEPISMGRRIAKELREGIRTGELDRLLT